MAKYNPDVAQTYVTPVEAARYLEITTEEFAALRSRLPAAKARILNGQMLYRLADLQALKVRA